MMPDIMCYISDVTNTTMMQETFLVSICANNNQLVCTDEYCTLDGRHNPPSSYGHPFSNCAIQPPTALPCDNYTISASFRNVDSIQGENTGHLGFMYNVVDLHNYDFVFFR